MYIFNCAELPQGVLPTVRMGIEYAFQHNRLALVQTNKFARPFEMQRHGHACYSIAVNLPYVCNRTAFANERSVGTSGAICDMTKG